MRPAVSHHLQIMKDAGIINMRKEGTKNYYYFDSEMASFQRLIAVLQLAVETAQSLPAKPTEE
ncbi:ArsR/SmtB family transcription factor [Butyricicoccus sp.]|uniref:ArsR/SmtB family transcription factor n=1 Tax=Butyricicoccus sp. TaxID=2049021 RepID=UPI003D7D7F56